MNALTMRQDCGCPERGTRAVDGVQLASLVAARLCHDLVSPLGAIGNGVELLEMSGDFPGIAKSPELALIGESVRAARARVKFYRMAFGHAPADQRAAVSEVIQLTHDYAAGARLTVDIDGGGDVSRVESRMLLLALMCMDSAMPWGGRVSVCRSGTGWRLVGEASRTRVERPLWGWLGGACAGSLPDPSPAEVHFPLLGTLSAEAGRPIDWHVDDKGAQISF